MVTFLLKTVKDGLYTYEYYPEDNRQSKPGIITLCTISKRLSLEKLAEEDFVCKTKDTPQIQNEISLDIDERCHFYADHVMCEIWDSYMEGTTLKSGTVVWY